MSNISNIRGDTCYIYFIPPYVKHPYMWFIRGVHNETVYTYSDGSTEYIFYAYLVHKRIFNKVQGLYHDIGPLTQWDAYMRQ